MTVDLKDFDWSRWRSTVPSAQDVVAYAATEPSRLTEPMAQGVFETARLSTGIAWRALQERNGVVPASPGQLDALGQMGDALRDVTPQEWGKLATSITTCVNGGNCTDIIMGAQLDLAMKAFRSAAVTTPVVGWVVEAMAMAVVVGQVIWREAQGEGPVALAPLTVDREADQAEGERVLQYLDAPDWTAIWMPPHDASQGSWVHHADVEYPSGYAGGRLWLGDQGGNVDRMGEGLIPGQAAVARQWQYRGKQASTGSTRLDALAHALGVPIAAGAGAASEIGRYTTYGFEYFRPSLAQLSQILWAEVSRVGDAMFRVNVDALEKAWDAYWSGWQLALNQSASEKNQKAALVFWNIIGGNRSGNFFKDWPRYGAKDFTTKIPERYRSLQQGSLVLVDTEPEYLPGVGSVDLGVYELAWGTGFSWMVTQQGVTRRYLDALREQQWAAVRTLQCAYLTGDEPGLGGKGSALWLEWETNRDKLLGHPALASLDFDRVPATDYTGTGDWLKAARKKRLGMLAGQVALATEPPPKAPAPMFAWGQGGYPRSTIKPGFAAVPSGGAGVNAGLGVLAILAAIFLGARR